jgi:hypothetical protein
MKKQLQFVLVMMLIAFLVSCKRSSYKEVGDMKQFNSLTKNHVIEIDMTSQLGNAPNTWANVFPVKNSLEIQEIISLIKKAESRKGDALYGKILLFKTANKKKFFLRVVIEDSAVCGKFFKSVQLKEYLDSLQRSKPKKPEPNLPQMPWGDELVDMPSGAGEPNLPGFEF